MKNRECAYCGAYNEDYEKHCVVCGKTLTDYPDYEDNDRGGAMKDDQIQEDKQ